MAASPSAVRWPGWNPRAVASGSRAMAVPAYAVRVVELGKRYEIGVRRASGRLYDKLGSTVGGLAGRPRENEAAHTIWALRDVTFDVPRGHVMGIIGRNGSGKSTLMKLLARVTAPTEGRAEVSGRVGALLQVGAGFHPELTGRDNIALSGAILGMSRAEISALEDRIIDFSEIEEFIDTPVKHYSSGMFLRLAFSVSSHLAAEVMLIDEVLAVGDAAFQEKCRQRIQTIVGEGRTVLLVTHSMSSIRSICHSALVLDSGHVRFIGQPHDAVAFYENEILHAHSSE
jgi:ABC-type polysaccharide/polyol phosphate transport system ATPase subunit